MDDMTNDPADGTIDPEGFGPETVDGKGPAGSEPSEDPTGTEPGDPELHDDTGEAVD